MQLYTKTCALLLLYCITFVPCFSQNTPTYSNEFLNIGIGARAISMANSQVAVVSDVTSGYWNPSGLLKIPVKYQASLMHAEYFAGSAQFDYAGFATPIDSSNFLGFSAIRFGVDNIPDTRYLLANGVINYDNIQFFSAADYAFLISYARKTNLLGGLRLGANFKIIYRNAGDFATAWGFGMDVGVQLDLKGWQFGLMVRDITGTFNNWNINSSLLVDAFAQTQNTIPKNSTEITLPKALLGIAKRYPVKNKFGVLAALDFTFTFDGTRNVLIQAHTISIDPHFGIELDYLQKLFLRGGVGNIQQIKGFDGTTYTVFQPSFGLGLQFSQFSVDYALTNMGDQSEALYSHIFSVKVDFK